MEKLSVEFPELGNEKQSRTFVYTSDPEEILCRTLPVVEVDLSFVFFLKEEYQKGYGFVPISIHQSEISDSTIKQLSGLK